jgi:hypothetical protein
MYFDVHAGCASCQGNAAPVSLKEDNTMNSDQIVLLLSHKSVWLAATSILTLVIGYYVFAAYVNTLDPPDSYSTKDYKRKYKFLTFLAKELKFAAKKAHIPVDKTVVLSTDDVKTITNK